MRLRWTIAALAATLISTSIPATVHAATLQATQGVVQINRGSGFEPVTGSTTVNPGDIVTVQPGGNAQVVYPDGSIQAVQPGAVVTVGPGSTAPATASAGGGQQILTQAATAPATGAADAGAADAGAAGGGAAGGAPAGAGGLAGLSGTTLAIGAVAVGVAVGAAVYVVQNQNKAASP